MLSKLYFVKWIERETLSTINGWTSVIFRAITDIP